MNNYHVGILTNRTGYTQQWRCLNINTSAAELFVSISRHLKLKLLTQFLASNYDKY